MYGYGSRQISSVAIEMAITKTREEEIEKKAVFAEQGIKTAAVDCGGEFISSVKKFVERAVVAAKREGVIKETHSEEGAVAGATREALSQISLKAVGFNVGGKIGIARYHDHISVAVFFGIGLLHLDEVAIGLGHRAIS
ncbi:MAG TPA: hut operon positive regulator HutP [Syntrophomonadaceae bacterium]|nr:hut operon positive regulator HutP [Syntrophomonadaceae bacterium]HHW29700.1 hut operon positive regulator HutP [Syntrophomonadaceae bacterium]